MNLKRHQIRTESESGDLLEAGFTWWQPIAWRERYITRALYVSLTAACVTYPVFHMWVTHKGPAMIDLLAFIVLATFMVGASIFALLVLLLLFDYFNWTVEGAAVTVTTNDEIWVTRPRRLFQKCGALEWMRLRLDASEITSIECVPMQSVGRGHYRHGGEDGYPAFSVCIYFLNGERFVVAGYLDESDASVVAAQLNIALRETRTVAARAA